MPDQRLESIIAAAILDYPYRPANAVAEHMISALSSAGYTIVSSTPGTCLVDPNGTHRCLPLYSGWRCADCGLRGRNLPAAAASSTAQEGSRPVLCDRGFRCDHPIGAPCRPIQEAAATASTAKGTTAASVSITRTQRTIGYIVGTVEHEVVVRFTLGDTEGTLHPTLDRAEAEMVQCWAEGYPDHEVFEIRALRMSTEPPQAGGL